jgi:hypothetical protein
VPELGRLQLLEQTSYLDVLLVLLVFWVPALTVWITLALREVRRLRRDWRDLKQELGGSAADGYPPPDPPTTDSQVP